MAKIEVVQDLENRNINPQNPDNFKIMKNKRTLKKRKHKSGRRHNERDNYFKFIELKKCNIRDTFQTDDRGKGIQQFHKSRRKKVPEV